MANSIRPIEFDGFVIGQAAVEIAAKMSMIPDELIGTTLV